MSVIKEFFCGDHGDFEASHPICPHFGCSSKEVIRTFKTPPKIGSDTTRRTDAGLRRTADSYHIDLRSAKEGESSKAPARGQEVIWGLENAQARTGMSAEAMLHRPQTYNVKDKETGQMHKWVDKYGGMQHAAELVGNTKLFESQVEKTSHKRDKPIT